MDFSNLSTTVRDIALLVPGFLLAITIHEFAHGYVANKLGDPTARLAGRLTFNPMSHLDPFGTLALLLTGIIGWAKPVPVDPRYLSNPRKDMLWISLAGPAANMIAAVSLALVIHGILTFFSPAAIRSGAILQPMIYILIRGVQINVGLGIFNLLPIPPLDGSGILAGLLPRHMAYQYEKLQPFGFIILLVLILSGAVSYLVIPPIRLIIGMLL